MGNQSQTIDRRAVYAGNSGSTGKPFEVVYIVRESGAKLVSGFDSPFLAKRFAARLEHGKSCLVVSQPN